MSEQSILSGKTILIVEDEEDLREPIAMEFESLGANALQAPNGVKAFEIIKAQKVDAVISDIRMPGGDGVALLRNIKSMDCDFPVVMLITGFSDLSREDAYDLGAEYILSKPFDLDDIVEAACRILTPKVDLWRREHLLNEATNNRIEKNVTRTSFSLGRGGFFLALDQDFPSLNANTYFLLRFADGSMSNLEGVGKVRWLRKTADANGEKGFGLEFEVLTEPSAKDLLNHLQNKKISAFIPKNLSS